VASTENADVAVFVYNIDNGRQISGARLPERLADRAADIRRGIHAGVGAVLEGIRGLPRDARWTADEVSASFALTLEAEAGVVLSKASASATLEISVTFRRTEQDEAPGVG
jgi:hypothetical protein